MKIKETIERDCCYNADMKFYQGEIPGDLDRSANLHFCIHCGQMWRFDVDKKRVKVLTTES